MHDLLKQLSLLGLLTFGLLLGNLEAQNGTPAAGGARGIAMGNTGLGFNDINAIFSNQAGLANLKEIEATVFGEQRFNLSEIKLVNAGVAIPTSAGVFGLTVGYFGFDQFNEQKIGLAYARRLSSRVSLSGQIDYLNTRIPEYGNKGQLTFELGVQSTLLKNLSIGAHIYSPVKVKINEDYVIPSIYKLGAMYQPSEKVLLTMEVEKDIDYPVVFKGGVEYMAAPGFYLRAGAGSNPTLMSFGLGYNKDQVKIDVASGYHLDLGFMPALSASFQF